MFLIKCYWMLQNVRVTAFTVSFTVIKGKPTGEGLKLPPTQVRAKEQFKTWVKYLNVIKHPYLYPCDQYPSTASIKPICQKIWRPFHKYAADGLNIFLHSTCISYSTCVQLKLLKLDLEEKLKFCHTYIVEKKYLNLNNCLWNI